MMKAAVILALVGAIFCGDDFDDGINFRILRHNFLNKELAGGIRFGVGYGVDFSSLDVSKVVFMKYEGGKYVDIDPSSLGNVEMKPYEEAFCDSDYEDNAEDDDSDDEGCYPAIKGFIGVDSAECELSGRYLLSYGEQKRRFNILVRQCGGRYDWFEDGYWSDQDSDDEFEAYYVKDQDDTFLSVNEDNFLNNGIMGGFRVRVGAPDLDVESMKVYKKSSGSLPEGMSLDKKIYEKTCAQLDDSDSDTDSDEEKVCKPALYGFVTAAVSECSMDGEYYLEYNGEKTDFNVYVKSCGNDDWDEYDSDYLYDSDEEDKKV